MIGNTLPALPPRFQQVSSVAPTNIKGRQLSIKKTRIFTIMKKWEISAAKILYSLRIKLLPTLNLNHPQTVRLSIWLS
jgi:hypothetical protein